MRLVKRNAFYQTNGQLTEELSKKFSLPPRLIELLFSRGIDSEEKIDLFLNGGTNNFHDPYLLKGMNEAAKRIKKAIEVKEKIVIFSDYDADGICAAAILSLYFKKTGIDVYTHIPDRITEGYGLNIDSLERIIDAVTPDLIITCDCGISCIKEVEYALDLGVDVIVTDHHAPGETIPECIVINPLIDGCAYPDKTLCGAAVALKLVQAISSIEESLEFTDIAAIATVADLVQLVGESRLITQLGLKTIASRKNLGLSRLMDYIKLQTPTSSDITYKIAPRINAAGRMGDASRAFDLLCAQDITIADNIIKEIDADNEKRKAVCDKIYLNAVERLKNERLYCRKSIILYDKEWEKGVIGIVAAKLGAEYRRPVIIMANAGETCKGTARSIEGINIHEALTKHSDLFVEFGGHSQAAGFTIKADRVEELKSRLSDYFDSFDDELFTPRAYYDIELNESDVNLQLAAALEMIEPYGHGNHPPLFKLSPPSLKHSLCKTNSAHVQIVMPSGLVVYAYNNRNKNQFLSGETAKHLLIEVQKSQNPGFSPLLVIARQIVCDELYIDDDYACANFLKTLNFKSKTENSRVKKYESSQLGSLCNGIYGTLFVAGSKESYQKAADSPLSKHIIISEFLNVSTKNNYNRLIVSPDFDEELPLWSYKKVVFLDSPPKQLLNHLSRVDADIYIPAKENFGFLKNVDLSREVFGRYFDIIRRNKFKANSITDYFEQIKTAESISLTQFVACLTVFIDLGIMFIGDKNSFNLEIDHTVRSPLTSSKIYNYLKEMKDPQYGKA